MLNFTYIDIFTDEKPGWNGEINCCMYNLFIEIKIFWSNEFFHHPISTWKISKLSYNEAIKTPWFTKIMENLKYAILVIIKYLRIIPVLHWKTKSRSRRKTVFHPHTHTHLRNQLPFHSRSEIDVRRHRLECKTKTLGSIAEEVDGGLSRSECRRFFASRQRERPLHRTGAIAQSHCKHLAPVLCLDFSRYNSRD